MGTPLALYVHKDVGDRDVVVDLIQVSFWAPFRGMWRNVCGDEV